MGNRSCCAVPSAGVPQKKQAKNKLSKSSYLDYEKMNIAALFELKDKSDDPQKENNSEFDDTDTYTTVNNKVIRRAKKTKGKASTKKNSKALSKRAKIIEIDLNNVKTCQLTEVVEASNEDQSSVWQNSVRFSKVGKLSTEGNDAQAEISKHFTSWDSHRYSTVHRIEESLEQREASGPSSNESAKIKTEGTSSNNSSPQESNKSSSSATDKQTHPKSNQNPGAYSSDSPTQQYDESEEIDFHALQPNKQDIGLLQDQQSNFCTIPLNDKHDYQISFRQDSSLEKIDTRISFLAQQRPQTMETYSKSIIHKSLPMKERDQVSAQKRISTAGSSNLDPLSD